MVQSSEWNHFRLDRNGPQFFPASGAVLSPRIGFQNELVRYGVSGDGGVMLPSRLSPDGLVCLTDVTDQVSLRLDCPSGMPRENKETRGWKSRGFQ